MKRLGWSLVIGVLGCFSLAGCAQAKKVSLARLAAQQQAFNGRVVQISGTVLVFADSAGRYPVATDNGDNRVELLPAGPFLAQAGHTVTVKGCFRVEPNLGRVIYVSWADQDQHHLIRMRPRRCTPSSQTTQSDRSAT